MAYQNVGTPRFYINDIDYARSVGLDIADLPEHLLSGGERPYTPSGFGLENYYKIINSDPSTPILYNLTQQSAWFRYKVIERPEAPANYVAYLNHNIGDSKAYIRHSYRLEEASESGGSWNGGNNLDPIVNAEKGLVDLLNQTTGEMVGHGQFATPLHGGFSIYGIPTDAADGYNAIHDFAIYISTEDWDGNNYVNAGYPPFQMGSIWVGRYYDMPHSPELDLTMTIENDGYDAITTQGGAHLSNIRYTGAPMWERADGTKVPPWTIGEPTAAGRRNGRRVWNLKFNYLNDSDLFASNYMNTTYLQIGSDTGYDSGDIDTMGAWDDFYYTLENDDSFHAQVLNKIGNGQRFIFQPDNTNNNPDQFAICQLDQDSLNIKQVANGVYNISLKIREVW